MTRFRVILGALLLTLTPGTLPAQPPTEFELLCANPTTMPLRRLCRMMPDATEPVPEARPRMLRSLRVIQAIPVPLTERWVSIGPAPISGGSPETTWTARPRSGRVAAIAVDPSNTGHWLIGAAGGGIWETRDSGASWQPRTDDQPALAIGAIAFSRSDPRIVYAGTGESVVALDAYGGAGILKSSDGGQTWTQLAENDFLNRGFSDLAVDPQNPDIVVATATPARVFRANPVLPKSGIVKSIDGGQTWATKKDGDATDLEVDPGNFNRQYAGMGKYAPMASTDNGVFRSLDAGETWQRLDGPWTTVGRTIGRVELAMSPSQPDVLYVSIHEAAAPPPASGGVAPTPSPTVGGLLGLWKTTNAWAACSVSVTTGPCPAGQGPAWVAIPTGATDGNTGFGYCGYNPPPESRPVPQCFYSHELSVDPNDPAVLYAGGISLWKYSGGTWQQIGFLSNDRGIHADQHRMRWAGNRLVVGNDGGVWSTPNGGVDWEQHNNGLGTIQFWGGAVAPTTLAYPSLLFALAGTQDNGTALWKPGPMTWTGIIRGDAGAPVVSSSKPATHWGIAGISKGLEIWRTIDGGTTLKPANGDLDPQVSKTAAIAAPFVACSGNHDVVLFADRLLWRTDNFFSSHPAAPAWKKNSAQLTNLYRKVTAVAFAPSDPTCRTYAIAAMDKDTAGNNVGWVQITKDAGMTWTPLNATPLPQARVPSGLAFDPRDANSLFLIYRGFAASTVGRVFRLSNALGGGPPSWTDESPGTDIPANAIAIDPADPHVVWLATDFGVWRGQWNDIANRMTWPKHYGAETGLPNVVVSDVKVHGSSRTPVVFTHGRGAYILRNLGLWCQGGWAITLGSNFGACR